MYYRVIKDNEGNYSENGSIVIISDKENILTEVDENVGEKYDLVCEVGNIFTYEGESFEELKENLEKDGFIYSQKLSVDENEEDLEVFAETTKTITKIITPTAPKGCKCTLCRTFVSSTELRDLAFDDYEEAYVCPSCDDVGISEEDFVKNVELSKTEIICYCCKTIIENKDLVVDEDGDFECPICEETLIFDDMFEIGVITAENGLIKNSTTSYLTSSLYMPPIATTTVTTTVSEEVEDEEETVIVPKISIKDWNDFVGNVKTSYDFLLNYANLCGGIKVPLFSNKDKITAKEFLDVLEENNIINTEFRTNYFSKMYDETVTIASKTDGSMDEFLDFVLVAMGCDEKIATDVFSFLSSAPNSELYCFLYFYWHAMMMAKDVKYSKAIMKNAMAYATKNLGKADDIFEFPEEEIPDEVINFVVEYGSVKKPTISKANPIAISTFEEENEEGNFYWDICNINEAGINRKYIRIVNESGSEAVSKEIVKSLGIRGVDVSTAPYFKIPSYVLVTEVPMLLSGIKNLTVSE